MFFCKHVNKLYLVYYIPHALTCLAKLTTFEICAARHKEVIIPPRARDACETHFFILLRKASALLLWQFFSSPDKSYPYNSCISESYSTLPRIVLDVSHTHIPNE